jgi:streptogramin lyase
MTGVSRSRRFRGLAAIAAAAAGIATLHGLAPAGAADPLGAVASYPPEAGAVLDGGLVVWQNEVLASKPGPGGGLTAFTPATGAAAPSPLVATGVVKSPIQFAGRLAWIDSVANLVRTATPGGTVSPLTGSVAGYDSMIAVGTDLWLSKAGAVERFTPNLTTNTLTSIGVLAGAPFAATSTMRMAVGPDNNVWIIENSAGVDTLTRWTAAGAIVGAPLNFPTNTSNPIVIERAADGGMWVLEAGTEKVARFDANLNKIELSLPTGSGPLMLAGTADGAMWVTEATTNNVARLLTAGGAITRTPYPAPAAFGLRTIVQGPDGNIWAAGVVANRVAKFGTTPPTTTTTSTTTTAAPTTTVAPTAAPTTAAPTTAAPTTAAPTTAAPTTAAPVTTIKRGKATYVCSRTAKRRVRVNKKLVTRTVCVAFRRIS